MCLLILVIFPSEILQPSNENLKKYSKSQFMFNINAISD